MNKAILLVTLFILIFIAGCTSEQEAQARQMIKENRCAAYNGYLCSGPGDCALPYLDTIDSYCCPIPCQTCNQTCDDGAERTEDYCSKATNYECQHNYTYPYSFERLDLPSCREEGKVKITEFGTENSMPTQYIEPLITELKAKYPIELKFYGYIPSSGHEAYDIETGENKTGLAEQYNLKATPTFIINCNIKREGGNKEGFETMIQDVLNGILI